MRHTAPFAATAVAVLLLAACADDSDAGSSDDESTTQESFPVTVGDLTLEEQPTRIVSLSPTVTEMLYAIDAGSQVAAVDEYSNYPEQAPTTELSGYNFNLESLVTHDPDLVVVSSYAEDIVSQLDEVGIPAYVAPDNAASMQDVYDQIVDLGALTGNDDAAGELVSDMSDRVATLTAEAQVLDEPISYYLEIDDNYWTYTSASLIGSLFAQVGLESIAQDPEDSGAVTTQLSAEAIIDADPDVIFLTNTDFDVDADALAERAGWDEITAVEQGHVVPLDGDIASRWGPRTVDLLEDAVAAVDAVAQGS